ncbi:MAG: WD40 repeat domain-containing protein [Raineya sp.]|jgi:WD40 repeat protein|nr:WD40 repeat domain-containing protein [Raineya sp.]
MANFLDKWKNMNDDLSVTFKDYKIEPLINYPTQADTFIAEKKIHNHFIGGMAVTDEYLLTTSEDSTFKIWKRESLELVTEIRDQNAPVNYIAFSPDKRYLAACSDDFAIRIYETAKWSLTKILRGHTDYVSKVEFTNNAVVSISKDGLVKVWDYLTGNLVFNLEGHEEWVYSLAVSPQKDKILTSALNSSLKLWDVQNGVLLKDLVEGSYLGYVLGMTIGGDNSSGVGNKQSPNSSIWMSNGKVATFSTDIVVWDDTTWQVLWQKDASHNKIKRGLYIAKYNMLVTGSEVLQGWNLDNGDLIFEEVAHGGTPIFSCAEWNNHYLYTGDEKGNLKVWNIDTLVQRGVKIQHTSDIYDAYYHKQSNNIFSYSYYSVVAWSGYGKPKKHIQGFKSNNTKVLGYLPNQPNEVYLAASGEIKVIDPYLLTETRTIFLDNDLVNVDNMVAVDENHIITYTISYKPRLINVRTGEIKILDTPCCFYNHLQISDEITIFSTYYGEPLDTKYPKDGTAPMLDCGFEFQAKNHYETSSPLFIFNNKTRKIEKELWYSPKRADDKIYPNNPIRIDEHRIAVTCASNICTIWDLRTYEITHRIQVSDEYIGFTEVFQGKLYIVGKKEILYEYDIQNFELQREKPLGVSKPVHHLFNAEKGLLSYTEGTRLYILDVGKFEVVFDEDMGMQFFKARIEDNLLMAGTKDGRLFTFTLNP